MPYVAIVENNGNNNIYVCYFLLHQQLIIVDVNLSYLAFTVIFMTIL